jgi:hypothetical protein
VQLFRLKRAAPGRRCAARAPRWHDGAAKVPPLLSLRIDHQNTHTVHR